MRRVVELLADGLHRARVRRWQRGLDRRMAEERNADVTRAFMRAAGHDPKF